MKINYGDGELALDRTLRSIVMISDAAVKRLETLGYHRGKGGIEIMPAPEGFPVYININDKAVFVITHEIENESLVIKGKWLKKISRSWKSWFIFSWFFRK